MLVDPEYREALIDLRVAELRVLAAKTATDFWHGRLTAELHAFANGCPSSGSRNSPKATTTPMRARPPSAAVIRKPLYEWGFVNTFSSRRLATQQN